MSDTVSDFMLERLTKLLLCLHLMPAQEMHDSVVSKEVETKALGLAPLTAPQRPLRPLSALAGTASSGTVRPRGHIRPINAPDQDRTAQAACCHLSNASLNLVT